MLTGRFSSSRGPSEFVIEVLRLPKERRQVPRRKESKKATPIKELSPIPPPIERKLQQPLPEPSNQWCFACGSPLGKAVTPPVIEWPSLRPVREGSRTPIDWPDWIDEDGLLKEEATDTTTDGPDGEGKVPPLNHDVDVSYAQASVAAWWSLGGENAAVETWGEINDD